MCPVERDTAIMAVILLFFCGCLNCAGIARIVGVMIGQM